MCCGMTRWPHMEVEAWAWACRQSEGWVQMLMGVCPSNWDTLDSRKFSVLLLVLSLFSKPSLLIQSLLISGSEDRLGKDVIVLLNFFLPGVSRW